MEQLDYNLLYRWFVGLAPDDPVGDATTFTKNRERLQQGDVFQKFMTKLLNHKQVKPLLSDEHFSVDGVAKELQADGSGDGDGATWHKQKRSNETHTSTNGESATALRWRAWSQRPTARPNATPRKPC